MVLFLEFIIQQLLIFLPRSRNLRILHYSLSSAFIQGCSDQLRESANKRGISSWVKALPIYDRWNQCEVLDMDYFFDPPHNRIHPAHYSSQCWDGKSDAPGIWCSLYPGHTASKWQDPLRTILGSFAPFGVKRGAEKKSHRKRVTRRSWIHGARVENLGLVGVLVSRVENLGW